MPSGYQIVIPPTSALHREEITLRLHQLRDYTLNRGETWFHSRKQIVDYLNEAGVTQKGGREINSWTLNSWVNKFAFPLFKMNNKDISTSNIMIQAWLWAFRTHQATKMYKQSTKVPYADDAY